MQRDNLIRKSHVLCRIATVTSGVDTVLGIFQNIFCSTENKSLYGF